MAQLINLETNKTFATEANAIKAVEKIYGGPNENIDLRYLIMRTNTGRYFPVFIGEKALQHMVHFNFHVVA